MNKVLMLFTVILGIVSIIVIGYWLFVGTGMTLNGGVICPQVITNARNPISGVTKTFANPCRIPVGWSII